jgi:uncharacterized repeat protein (TIGR03803 family)
MKSIPHQHLANRDNALNKKDYEMKSRKFGCGLALALLIPVSGAYAKSSETVLYSFTGGADGSNPYGALIEDVSGNLYGTAVEGGAKGVGTVFKLAPDGTETVLWSFSGADGSYPEAGLIMDKKGNLYGTTSYGGAGGKGTVFEVAPSGTETVLWSFSGGADGSDPMASLIIDKKGNLYGTTVFGGANGDGTVFEVPAGGTETVLYSFGSATNGTDGVDPLAGLMMDKKGSLYGTTNEGGIGTGCGSGGCGVVFKLAPHGKSWTETVLHSFAGGTDGAFPTSDLIEDKSGNLYGTTYTGGGSLGDGIVFEVAPDGTETVLWTFTGPNGAAPEAGLIMDKKGKLFGTTFMGGANGYGAVFELAPDGTEKVLYSFDSATNGTDGILPYAGLIQDKSGNLFGAAYGGGADANGAIFKVTKH